MSHSPSTLSLGGISDPAAIVAALAVCGVVGLLVVAGIATLDVTRSDPADALPGMTIATDPIEGSHAKSQFVVTSLQSDGAARQAGIAVGDVVEAIDGTPLRSKRQLASLDGTTPHVSLTMRIRRDDIEVDRSLDSVARPRP